MRGDVDDRTPSLRQHGEHAVFADEEGSLEVDVDHPVPFLGVEQVDGSATGNTGCMYDGIELAVLGEDLVERVTDGRARHGHRAR